MRIMTILGSPRSNGNTARVLEWIERELESNGHEVDHAHILDYRVEGCRECFGCRSGDVIYCALNDDANVLFERMIAADLVLLATPLFCWGYPAQIKALIDRIYCLVGDFHDPNYSTKIQGRSYALLVTSGGPAADNAELLIRGFDNMVRFCKACNRGYLHVPFCTTPDALTSVIQQNASAFARTLMNG